MYANVLYPFWILFAFVIGLLFGSFANVVIYRLPLKKSIASPPSFCPSCAKRLQAIDLVPIVSWVVLLGKCRFCKTKISPRYPIVEFICGLLFASMVYYSPTLSAIMLSTFALILLIVSCIDLDTQEIPDSLLICGSIIGLVWLVLGYFFPTLFPYAPSWQSAILGTVSGATPLLIIDKISLIVLKKDGFGYGDVKLMAVVGLFLGWQVTLSAFFFAFISGGVFAAYLLASGKAKRGTYMAFGPFLCISVLISFWFGPWFFNILFRF